MAGFPQVYNPNQPTSGTNPAPSIAIASLSTVGVPAGTTYNPIPYSQPGVSALIGFAPTGTTPGNPSQVLPSIIVRAIAASIATPVVPTPAPAAINDALFFAALSGTLDGVNNVFTLTPAPISGAMIFWNGLLLTPGVQHSDPPGQYSLAGNQVTFQPQAIPQPGVKLLAFVY